MPGFADLWKLEWMPYDVDEASGRHNHPDYIQFARDQNAIRKINDLTYKYAMKLYSKGMLSESAKNLIDNAVAKAPNPNKWSHKGYVEGENILDIVYDDLKNRKVNESVSDWVKNIRNSLDYYRYNPNKDTIVFPATMGLGGRDAVYGIRDDEYDKLLNRTIDALAQSQVPPQKHYEIAAPAMSREIQEARADQGIGAKARYMGQYTVYPTVGVSTRRLRSTQPYYRRNVAGKIIETKPLNPILKETEWERGW